MGSNAYELIEIFRYKELLRNLVARDIKVRYKRSVLGFLWVMLNPLLMMLILYIVFSQVFRVQTKNYIAYLLSGLTLWNFFAQSTSTALTSFLINSNLIKKIYLPKSIFPLSIILSAAVNFAFTLVPLLLILVVTGTTFSGRIVLLPLAIGMVGLFGFGVSLILATMATFFHDTLFIYEVVLSAWMYLTPVIYPESIIPGKFSLIFRLNPFYYFVNVFRGILYLDVPNFFEKVLYGLLCSLAVFTVGWLFYQRNRDRLVYHL